jgi:hypothetical protein
MTADPDPACRSRIEHFCEPSAGPEKGFGHSDLKYLLRATFPLRYSRIRYGFKVIRVSDLPVTAVKILRINHSLLSVGV